MYLPRSGVTGGALNDLEAGVNGAQTVAVGFAEIEIPLAEGNTKTREGRV